MTINGIYNNNSSKAKETEISKYGCVFQKTNKFIEARKNTCIEKYGVENPFSSKEFKQKMIKFGKWIKDEERPLIGIYYKEVAKHTYRNAPKIPNIEKRGLGRLNNNAFEIDHKYSIIEGFKNNIPPYIIGGVYNLEMLHWKDNAKKSSKCSITLNELLSSFNKSRFT